MKFINDNPILSSVVGGIILALLAWTCRRIMSGNEARKIYAFLYKSTKEEGYTFRTSEVISSHTGIPMRKIDELCSRHPKIKRNEKAKESWRIVE